MSREGARDANYERRHSGGNAPRGRGREGGPGTSRGRGRSQDRRPPGRAPAPGAPPAPRSPARPAPSSSGGSAGMQLLKRQGAQAGAPSAQASSGVPATPPRSWAALLGSGAAPPAAPTSPSPPAMQVGAEKKDAAAAPVAPSPAPTPPVASPRASPAAQQPTSPTGAPPPVRLAPWAKPAATASDPPADQLASVKITEEPAAAAAAAVAPAAAAAPPPVSPRSFSFQRGTGVTIVHEAPPVAHSGGSTPKASEAKAAAPAAPAPAAAAPAAPAASAAPAPAMSWAAKAKAVAAVPAPKPAPKPAVAVPKRAEGGHAAPRSGAAPSHAGPKPRRADDGRKPARQAPPAKPAAAAIPPPPQPPAAESVSSEELNSTLRTHQLPSVSSASSSGAEVLPTTTAPARAPSPPPLPPPPPPPLPSNEALDLLVNADVDACWRLGAGDAAAAAVRLQPRGIKNPGNLCFVNAVLQGLMGSSSFCRLMEALRSVGSALDQGTYPILYAMAAVAAEFERRPAVAAAPPPPAPTPAAAKDDSGKKRAEIVSVLGGHPMSSALVMELIHRFSPRQRDRAEGQVEQEDAQEFLHFVLDKMDSELLELRKQQRGGEDKGPENGGADARGNDDDGWLVQSGKKAVKQQIVSAAPSQEATAVTALFEGKLATCVACAGAPNSVTVHPFQIVPLNIYSDAIRSIDDALEAMTAAETLPDYKPADDAEPREAAKSERFLSLPDLLVLHLMRFQFTGRSAKISKHVAFEPRLAMRASWLAPGCPDRGAGYDLVAAVTHHGKSIGSGHYTADAVQPDGTWLRFDDADVYCVKEAQVLADRPYMLIYQRRQGSGK